MSMDWAASWHSGAEGAGLALGGREERAQHSWQLPAGTYRHDEVGSSWQWLSQNMGQQLWFVGCLGKKPFPRDTSLAW